MTETPKHKHRPRLDPQSRRQAREYAMQFLFGLDFTGYEWDSAIDSFWDTVEASKEARDYAMRLIEGVSTHWDELDTQIAAVLENWSPERIGRIERAILRVALHEMKHERDVPPGVAINEALEVAKRFGSDDSVRFINGILDKLRARLENEPECC